VKVSNLGYEKFNLLKTTGDWYNILSEVTGRSISKTTIQPSKFIKIFDTFEIDIYSVNSTFNKNEFAEIKFISAGNRSNIQINYKYILGTNLNEDTYYCLKSVFYKNGFLKSDGIKHANYYGLDLVTTEDNNCPEDDNYYFKVEYDQIKKFVKIKNKGSQNFISLMDNRYFVLSKVFNYNLTFISNIINSVTIRTSIAMNFSNSFYFAYVYEPSTESRMIAGFHTIISHSFIFTRVPQKNRNNTATIAKNDIILLSIVAILTTISLLLHKL